MVSGRCLEGAGRCLKGVWKVSGMCVQSALCLIGVWKVSKMCLEGISNLEQTFIRNWSLTQLSYFSERCSEHPKTLFLGQNKLVQKFWVKNLLVKTFFVQKKLFEKKLV